MVLLLRWRLLTDSTLVMIVTERNTVSAAQLWRLMQRENIDAWLKPLLSVRKCAAGDSSLEVLGCVRHLRL